MHRENQTKRTRQMHRDRELNRHRDRVNQTDAQNRNNQRHKKNETVRDNHTDRQKTKHSETMRQKAIQSTSQTIRLRFQLAEETQTYRLTSDRYTNS